MRTLRAEWHEQWVTQKCCFTVDEYYREEGVSRAAPVAFRVPSEAWLAAAVCPTTKKPIYSTIGT